MKALDPTLLSLLPVLVFLAGLVFLDSYKLVSLTTVVALQVVGACAAAASYVVDGWLVSHVVPDLTTLSRYVSPFVEEAAKAVPIVWLIRRHRIAFLVDAAIMGFAVGCGFALVENAYALWRVHDAALGTWLVRGFGTAIMHGGVTAAFAVVTLGIQERDETRRFTSVLPGYGLAVALHSGFNHLSGSPQFAALAALVVVPVLLMLAYHRGEQALGDWLGRGFDDDTQLLALIRSGDLPSSPAGRYLATLRRRFAGPLVADVLCYLRVFTELTLRAKGLLLMRENGFDAPLDDEMRAKFAELRYLERTIGPTGMLSLAPLLPMRRRALRQINEMEA